MRSKRSSGPSASCWSLPHDPRHCRCSCCRRACVRCRPFFSASGCLPGRCHPRRDGLPSARTTEERQCSRCRTGVRGGGESLSLRRTRRRRECSRPRAICGSLRDRPARPRLALDKALSLPGLEAEQRGEALLDRARAAKSQGDLTTARARLERSRGHDFGRSPSTGISRQRSRSARRTPPKAQAAIAKALALAPSEPDDPVRSGPRHAFRRRRRPVLAIIGSAPPPTIQTVRSASQPREALAMLPAPTTIVTQPQPRPSPRLISPSRSRSS